MHVAQLIEAMGKLVHGPSDSSLRDAILSETLVFFRVASAFPEVSKVVRIPHKKQSCCQMVVQLCECKRMNAAGTLCCVVEPEIQHVVVDVRDWCSLHTLARFVRWERSMQRCILQLTQSAR